jgi:hypothetical protein
MKPLKVKKRGIRNRLDIKYKHFKIFSRFLRNRGRAVTDKAIGLS